MFPTDWSFLFQMGWKVVKIFRSKWCKKYENSEDLSGFWGFEGGNYPGVNWLGVTIGVEVSLWLINKTWSMTSWHHEFIVDWSGYPQEWLTAQLSDITIIIYDPTIYEVDPSMIRNPGLNDNLGLTLDYHLSWILPPAKCDATISNRHPNHVGSDWGTIWQSIERRPQFCTSPANRG